MATFRGDYPPSKDSRTSHVKRRSSRLAQPFIAWDGEGQTDLETGEHRYVMLCNSLGDYIENPLGLGTKTVFEFMLGVAAKFPKAIHVGYGFGYDATMILRELRRDVAEAIIENETPRGVDLWMDGVRYSVTLRHRKRFAIAAFHRNAWKLRGAAFAPNYRARICIWDVFGYFQTSFVDALRKNGIAEETRERIAAMKRERAYFRPEGRQEQLQYCFDECRALVALCEDLRNNLAAVDLLSGVWDGPGALAGTLYRKRGVAKYIEREPIELARPFAQAYFGGRIEAVSIGSAEHPIFEADIVSAYPSHIRHLPTLHGEWKKTDRLEGFGLAHVRFYYPWRAAPFYPLPFRMTDGRVLFPREGAGWYCLEEIGAAMRHAERFGGSIVVDEIWTLEPESDVRPFAFIDELFAERARRKAAGDPSEKVLKLTANSCYGKTVSQLGGTPEKRPTYFSFVWGAAITARTRAQLLDAALLDPNAVVSFATDALYTSRPLLLDYGKDLGQWERADHAQGVFVQAGVYWTGAPGSWRAKNRGFDREGMHSPDPVVEAWAAGAREIFVPSTRFVTLKAALARGDYRRRGTWETTPRRLRLDGGGKRQPLADLRPCAQQLVQTWPRDVPPGSPEESAAYDSLLWKREDVLVD